MWRIFFHIICGLQLDKSCIYTGHRCDESFIYIGHMCDKSRICAGQRCDKSRIYASHGQGELCIYIGRKKVNCVYTQITRG